MEKGFHHIEQKKEFYASVDKTPYEAPTNAYNLNKLGRFCDRYKLI